MNSSNIKNQKNNGTANKRIKISDNSIYRFPGRKRLISLALTICILLSYTVPATAASNESNVIQAVKALEIMQGDENGNLSLKYIFIFIFFIFKS